LRGQGLKEKERYKFQLLGPAPIEKLLKTNLKVKRTKSRFESLITRSPGKKKLALADDPKPGVSRTEGFEDETCLADDPKPGVSRTEGFEDETCPADDFEV
jgi:Protein of unknown function (DUF2800)